MKTARGFFYFCKCSVFFGHQKTGLVGLPEPQLFLLGLALKNLSFQWRTNNKSKYPVYII
jgi:hypothetical protein